MPPLWPNSRLRTLGTRLSRTSYCAPLPIILNHPPLAKAPLSTCHTGRDRDHLPAQSAQRREECGASLLTRSLEPCPGRLPAPARSAGPRAAAGGAATEPALLGSEPPRRLLAPPIRRSLNSQGVGRRGGPTQPQGVCHRNKRLPLGWRPLF